MDRQKEGSVSGQATLDGCSNIGIGRVIVECTGSLGCKSAFLATPSRASRAKLPSELCMFQGAPHLVQASDMMAMRQLSSTMLIVKTKRHLQQSSGQGTDQCCWESETHLRRVRHKGIPAHEVNEQCKTQGRHQDTQALPSMCSKWAKQSRLSAQCRVQAAVCQDSHEDHANNRIVGAVEQIKIRTTNQHRECAEEGVPNGAVLLQEAAAQYVAI